MRKKILYISFIPYICVLLLCTYYAVFGYQNNYGIWFYGIDAIGYALGNIFYYQIEKLLWLIFTICMSYQMYYIITLKPQSKSLIKKIPLKEIILIICILSWVIYFLSGIYAFFFGYVDSGGWLQPKQQYFGLEALIRALLINMLKYVLVIPVLPVTGIYMFIYFIIYLIERDRKLQQNKEN